MQCPSCKSDYVQKLRLIYESGTSDIQATSHGSTIGYSTGGGLYTGATTTHTSGQSMTRAAQKASPPEKRRYRLVIVPLLLSWQFLTMKSQGWVYLGWLMIGIACWIVYRAYTYNKKVWPGEYHNWNRSWHCNKCGHIYVN